MASLVDQFPLMPFLVVDRADGALHVGVAEPDLAGDQPREVRLDVLRVRQRVDLVVVSDVEKQIQLARLVVVQLPVIAQLGRVALAAALSRAEEVVEVRAVPRQLPSQNWYRPVMSTWPRSSPGRLSLGV